MPLAKCDCKHPYQDAHYGIGVRVHNLCKSAKAEATTKTARCTVCGKERVI